MIATGYPVYISSTGSIAEVAGDTLLVAKHDVADYPAIYGKITKVSGGYFCCEANNLQGNIFTPGQTFADGKDLSAATTPITAEADDVTYNCWYLHTHSWGDATYTWAEDNSTVTATVTCTDQYGNTHDVTETAETTSEITTPATCEAMGETTYTATFENEAFAAQTRTVEDVPVAGHAWGEPTYTWSDDNATVTATRVCANDDSHVETETVNTTSEVTKAATCEAMGETTYTAAFENEAFET